MSDFVLAEELTIPQNIIDRLGQLERRVNDIAYKSENMGTKFNLAINSMNDSKALAGLVQKVTSIKNAMADLSKIGGVGFSNLTSDAEKSAEKITSVANAFGQMSAQQSSVAGLVEELRKLNEVIANGGIKGLGDQSKVSNNALKKNIDQQKDDVKSYEKALQKVEDASSINERANALQRLIKVRNALSMEDENYAHKLDTLNKKIQELNRLNKESKKTEEELAKEKEASDKQIIDAERKKQEALQREHEKEERQAKQRIAQFKREVAEREKLARQKQKEYDSTPKGALESADKAKTYAQRAQAMKNLETAIKHLDSTDANYQKNLRKLSETYHKLDGEQKKVETSLGRIREKQSQVGDVAGQLARKLALVFSVSQIQGYISKIVRVRGEFEKQNIALGSILQNKDQADKLFGQIQALAVKSPFTVMELSSYTKQLSAYQVKYEDLYDTTKRLADVSAGLGVDMQRFILAFGQVKAANYLRGTEVRQFTEAGLNILGELAKKYSELEGQIVSVGEVQERVSKRMVSFEDVADVFDRITKEGGLFYNMQEKLSESLAGQMSNLHDSIDIMLNDIGNANNGVLKFFIKTARTLVENWETFANILTGISVALVGYAIKAIYASKNTGLFSMSVAEAKASLYGMQLALFKVGNAFKSFLAFAKSNWIIAVIGAVVMASQQLIDHAKHVDEARKKYDILSRSLQKNEDTLNKLVSSIKQNQSILENTEIEILGLEKGTKEFSDTQADLNDLQSEQSRLLNELKTQYPEVYNEMVNSKKGIEGLTDAQREYNEELQKSGALNAILKDSVSFFGGDINKAFANYKEAYSENEKTLKEREGKLSAFFSELKGLGRKDESLFSTEQYEQIEAIYKSSKNISTKWKEIGEIVRKNPLFGDKNSNSFYKQQKYIQGLFFTWDRFNYTASQELNKTEQDLEGYFKKAFDFIDAEYNATNKETFGKLDEDTQKEAKKVVKTVFDSLDGINEKIVRDFVNKKFTIQFGFELYTDNAKKSLSGIWKDINEYIDDKGLFNSYKIRKIGIDEDVDKYFEYIKGIYDNGLKEIEKYNIAKYQYGKDGNKKLAENKKEEARILSEFAKRYGYDFGKGKKGGSKRDYEMEMFKKRIDLLKKANAEYEKLRQYKSKSESQNKVFADFVDAFSELKLSKSFIKSLEFDKQGLIDAVMRLGMESGERFKVEAEKTVSPIRSELELELSKSEFEKAKENIEQLFGDYELSLQFNEAGFDVGALKDFLRSVGSTEFEISELELPQLDSSEYFDILRNKIKELRAQGGKEDVEQANDFEKKLTGLMLKEAQDRYKELLDLRKKFATNEQQIVELQLKKEELQRQSFIASRDGNVAELERLTLKIREVDDEILRLKTEALQLTDFWKKAFGDLNDYSANTLKTLIQKARDILEDAKPHKINGEIDSYIVKFEDLDGKVKDVSLTLSMYQQLLRKLSNLENELKGKDPFSSFFDAIKNGKDKGESTADYFIRLSGIFGEMLDQSKDLALNIADIFGAGDDTKKTIEGVFNIMSGAKDLGVGIARISSGDIWGGVMQAAGGLSKAINAFREIHDRKLQKQIDQQKEKVEALQHAYEKLGKAIENALNIDAKSTNFDKAIANIDAQIASTYRMISLEKDKKKSDKGAIKEYRKQIEELEEMKAELKAKALSDVGGFGSVEDVKSAANDFAKAWLDAYRETGDGLDVLNKKWDEYIDNIIASQLMLKGTERFLKPLMDYVDKSLEDFNFTPDEASKLQSMIDEKMPLLNEYWKSIAGAFDGLTNAPKLGGLSKGIQSITEQTAQALEALLNSIRYMVNEQNNKLDDLRAIYSLLINFPQNNPLLQELRLQTQQMRNMHDLWVGMSKISQGNGRALKVMIV